MEWEAGRAYESVGSRGNLRFWKQFEGPLWRGEMTREKRERKNLEREREGEWGNEEIEYAKEKEEKEKKKKVLSVSYRVYDKYLLGIWIFIKTTD